MKNKKDRKKHGVISIVQSPNEENIKSDNLNKSVPPKKEDETEEHGIISIVQSPDEVRTSQFKTRKFHWNVAGESFMELDKLFQAQYIELGETIDEIAERINKLGGKTIGTMKEFVALTRLKESPNKYPEQKDMMKELLHDHDPVIELLRKDIEVCTKKTNDVGTVDFLTGVLQKHETTAWVLRRYLS
jgi:starvation-inducible DNA-binding protein